MLNQVHRQLLASKTRDLFASCPLVLVYQTVGNVRSSQVMDSLQRAVNQSFPDQGADGIRATCLKIKNSVVQAGSRGSNGAEAGLGHFLQANNILVGWQVPSSSQLSSMHASRTMRLANVLCAPAEHNQPIPPSLQPGNSSAATQSPSSPAHFPHSTVSALLQLSLQLPGQLPVALLASFYRKQPVRDRRPTRCHISQ